MGEGLYRGARVDAVKVDWTNPVIYMMQTLCGMHDMVVCRHCGWMCERMEIGEMGYGDDACGYFKIRYTERWCPSCGLDWDELVRIREIL
jgi:hypothetical protein